MNVLSSFLSIVFVISSVGGDIVRTDNIEYGNFVKMTDFVLRGEPLATSTHGNDDVICAISCIKNPGCNSYNYGPKSMDSATCSLMATDHYRNASSLEPLRNHDYFYRASACDSSPCQNNATCVPLYSQRSINCLCAKDFIGNHCEIPCDQGALGMENGQIADEQLSQSSYDENNPVYGEARGRLNTPDWPYGALFYGGDTNTWFQVDLLQQKYVTGLATQGYGYPGSGAFVSTYQISWSNDGTTWLFYQDGQQGPKTFDGNSDNQGIVKNEFTIPIKARWIKIIPKTCNENHCALRIELYGCSI